MPTAPDEGVLCGFVILVVYRAKVKICFQSAQGVFYFPYGVVCHPSGMLFLFIHVRTQQIHSFFCCDLLLFPFQLCNNIAGIFRDINIVVAVNTRIYCLQPPNAFADQGIPLRSALLADALFFFAVTLVQSFEQTANSYFLPSAV